MLQVASVSILEKCGVFNTYFELAGLHSRGGFVQSMIRNMDYTKYVAQHWCPLQRGSQCTALERGIRVSFYPRS